MKLRLGKFGDLLFFLGLAALFYAPILFGVRTFPDGDFTHHFLPFALFQRQELLAGNLPLWNPYTYSGHPFLADIQAAVFYPLSNLLLWLTLPWGEAGERLYILQIEAILQVALAGWFTALLVQKWTQNRWAGLVAGSTFAFSGYLTGYPPLQLAILRTVIWLPLILYFLDHAFETGGWHWWIAAAFTYATAFFAGHPQSFLHISYWVAGYALLQIILIGRQNFREGARRMVGLLFFYGASALLSAAQLLPSLEFTQLSVRANTDYAFVSGGFPLVDSLQMLMPAILTLYSPLYVGVVSIGLAGIALVSLFAFPRTLLPPALQRSRPVLLFSAIAALLALLLSYGDHGFLYPLFYRLAPGWKLFRGQERAAFLVCFGLSLLAGYGAALLPQLVGHWRRRSGLWLLALICTAILVFGLFWQLDHHSALSHGQYLIVAFLSALVAELYMLLLWLPGWGMRQQRLILGLLLLNLFAANFTTNIAPFAPERKMLLAPEMEALGQAVSEQAAQNPGLAGRVYNEFRIYEDYGMRQRIEDVWGSSPLKLARYAQLFAEFPTERMWQLLGVEHVLTWRRELALPSQLLAEFPQASDTTFLHRLQSANPRVWLVGKSEVVDDTSALQRLADQNFDLAKIALLAPESAPFALDLEPGASEIGLQRMASNQLHVTINSANGGLLILSENWMPGWQVRNLQEIANATGCSTPTQPIANAFSVQRADLTLLGIPVLPCAWEFDLLYFPDSVRYGLWLSAGTLAILLLAFVWLQAKGRNRAA